MLLCTCTTLYNYSNLIAQFPCSYVYIHPVASLLHLVLGNSTSPPTAMPTGLVRMLLTGDHEAITHSPCSTPDTTFVTCTSIGLYNILPSPDHVLTK